MANEHTNNVSVVNMARPAHRCTKATSPPNAATPSTRSERALARNGASLGDIVKMVSYMTDARNQAEFAVTVLRTFGATPMPAHAAGDQAAAFGMMLEIDVTAAVPLGMLSP